MTPVWFSTEKMSQPILTTKQGAVMNQARIEKLGIVAYGGLVLGIVNSQLRSQLGEDVLQSLWFTIPFLAVNIVAVVGVFWCLGTFLLHLLNDNKKIRGGWKVVWLFLLLLGNLVVMPVYWYWYIVREQLLRTQETEEKAAVGSATGVGAVKTFNPA
jgi:hypothetical protein